MTCSNPEQPRRRGRAPFQQVPRPSFKNRAARGVWGVCWTLLFRPSPRTFHRWRSTLLRAFGARVGDDCLIYPTARIWAPWNLTMEDGSCLGDWADCYDVAPIKIGRRASVSQYAYLCSASHDYTLPSHPLIISPITLEEGSWVAAQVFVAPGVTVGARAVVAARSVVLNNVPPDKVVAGHPARVTKDRVMRPE